MTPRIDYVELSPEEIPEVLREALTLLEECEQKLSAKGKNKLAIYRLALRGLEADTLTEENNRLVIAANQAERRATDLRAQVEQLQAWKESAISVDFDRQRAGKLLGLRLGDSIHDKIIPALERLANRDGEMLALREALNRTATQLENELQWFSAEESTVAESLRFQIAEALQNTTPSATAIRERIEREAWNEAVEEAAKVCGAQVTYAIDLEEWNRMSKKEHGVYACEQCAAFVRALRKEG
jgi:hypothetical protein